MKLKFLTFMMFFFPVFSFAQLTVYSHSINVLTYDEGLNESNMLKPRIKIQNTSSYEKIISKLYYYFSVENNKTPVLQDYYTPNCSVSLEKLSGDNYRVVYDYGNKKLLPGQILPDDVGNVVGLHYSDWSTWDKENDYSNNSVSSFMQNLRIGLYDQTGMLIFGSEPNVGLNDTVYNNVECTINDSVVTDEDGDGYAYVYIKAGKIENFDKFRAYWYEDGVGQLTDIGESSGTIRFPVGRHIITFTAMDLKSVTIFGQGYTILTKKYTVTVLPKPGTTVHESKNIAVYIDEETPIEANLFKPRIIVKNNGTTPIDGFYYYYYLNPDNNDIRLQDFFTPDANVSLEKVNNNLVRVKYDCTNKVLNPYEMSPTDEGNLIGISNSDWSYFDNENDFSYPGEHSTFISTKNVPVYDKDNNLIYGIDPSTSDTAISNFVETNYITDYMQAANQHLADSLGITFGPNPLSSSSATGTLKFFVNNPALIGSVVQIGLAFDDDCGYFTKYTECKITQSPQEIVFPEEFENVYSYGALLFGRVMINAKDYDEKTAVPFYLFVK